MTEASNIITMSSNNAFEIDDSSVEVTFMLQKQNNL
jgi:hypothetical protein